MFEQENRNNSEEPYILTDDSLARYNRVLYDFSRAEVPSAGEAGLDINNQTEDFEVSEELTDGAPTFEEELGNRSAEGRPDVNLRSTDGIDEGNIDRAMSRRTQEVLSDVNSVDDALGDEGGLRQQGLRSAVLDITGRDTLETREQRANEQMVATEVSRELARLGVDVDEQQVMERYLGQQANDERDGNHADADRRQPNIANSKSLDVVELASIGSQFVDAVRAGQTELLGQLDPSSRAEVVGWLQGIDEHGGGTGETNERIQHLGEVIKNARKVEAPESELAA